MEVHMDCLTKVLNYKNYKSTKRQKRQKLKVTFKAKALFFKNIKLYKSTKNALGYQPLVQKMQKC